MSRELLGLAQIGVDVDGLIDLLDFVSDFLAELDEMCFGLCFAPGLVSRARSEDGSEGSRAAFDGIEA